MVNLFYQQMEEMMEGWMSKTMEQDSELPDNFDTVYGIKLINYIADMFDYMEKYKGEAEAKFWSNISLTRETCMWVTIHGMNIGLWDTGQIHRVA